MVVYLSETRMSLGKAAADEGHGFSRAENVLRNSAALEAAEKIRTVRARL
jgi:hypothetical protein